MVTRAYKSQLLRRLRQEKRLDPGGRRCCELRSHYCTPAWATRANSVSKKKKKERKEKKKENAVCRWEELFTFPRRMKEKDYSKILKLQGERDHYTRF